MMWDFLFDILLKVPKELINMLPVVTLSDLPIPDYTADWLSSMLRYLDIFFPMELVSFVISAKMELKMARIQYAFARFVRSNVVGMGG